MSRRPQLSDEVADYVRELILSGKARPGDFLRQDKIAEELDTSATPVREGLLALRGEGFVTLEPRRGFMVAPLSTKDINDMFFAQADLMSELAARATENLTDDVAERLTQTQVQRNHAAEHGNPELVDRSNFEFHRLINLAADSQKLVWILAQLLRYTPRGFYQEIPGWEAASANDHQAIIDAMVARNAEEAREAMRVHMQRAGDYLVRYLELSETWSQPDGSQPKDVASANDAAAAHTF